MASDSRIQDVENFVSLMQDFRDELVAWDGGTQDYPLLPPTGEIQKEEEKKSTSSADEESRAQSCRILADERFHEQKCLFLRRTIPTVAEKWRKRRVSSSNSLESVFIMQCCWVPVTAKALDSSSSGLNATGRLPPTSGRRRPPSSVFLSSPGAMLSTDKGAVGSTYLSHLLCGLSDGTLCLVNVLNFSKSYLIEGYGMREQKSREETKGHHFRSSSSSHRHDQDSDSERGGSGAIVALDCAVPPLRSVSLSESTTSATPTANGTRSIGSATSKRLLALEINTTPSAASSTSTAGNSAPVVICVAREKDGVYVRQVSDIFDRSNHKNLFPGMLNDPIPSTTLSTASSSLNSSSSSSLPKRLLTLPPFDPRIIHTTPTSTVIIDRPNSMEGAEGLSRRSAVVGLRSTPIRMENHRRNLTGLEKQLPSDKMSSSAFPFSTSSSGRLYTIVSFSECREYILVAVPPSGSGTDAVLRPLRERYAISILGYKPSLSSASPPRAGTSLSSTMNSSLHQSTATVHNSSGISTGSTSGGMGGSNTRTPTDLQYDVEVPWCSLPFPRSFFNSSEEIVSTARLPITRTPTMGDSRSSYPTPVLIRWWDSIALSSKGDFVNEEKIHKSTLLVENDRAGSSPILCPRILVVWSSGDVQLLQPWRTVVSASFLPEHAVENAKIHDPGIRGRLPASSSSSSEEFLCFSLRVVAQTRLLLKGVGNASVEDKKASTAEVFLQPGEKVVTAAKAWLPEERYFRTVPITKTANGSPTSTTSASASSSTGTPLCSVPLPVSCRDGGSGLLAVVMGDNIVEVFSLQFLSRIFLSPSSSFSNDSSMKRQRDEDVNRSSPSSIPSVGLTEGTEVAEIVATPLCQSYCSQDIPINDIHLVRCSSFSSPTLSPSAPNAASASVSTLVHPFSHSSSRQLLSSLAPSSSSGLLVLTVVLRSGVVVLFDLPRMRELTTCVVGHLVDRSRLLQVMKTITLPSESGSASDYRSTNGNNLSSGGLTALGGRTEGESSRAGGGRRDETQPHSSASVSSSGFPSSEVRDERFLWEWPPKMRAVVVSAGTGVTEKPALNICLLDHDTVGVPERFS